MKFLFNGKKRAVKAHYESYQSDKINDFDWTWNWNYNKKTKLWNIVDLKTPCPRCGNQLTYTFSRYYKNLTCFKCNYNVSVSGAQDPNNIKKIIQNRMKTT